jgi:hypothetical protein
MQGLDQDCWPTKRSRPFVLAHLVGQPETASLFPTLAQNASQPNGVGTNPELEQILLCSRPGSLYFT